MSRLQALSAAHSVLTREYWQAAPLRDVIHDALIEGCGHQRVVLRGDHVDLSPNTAVSIALAIHELCTNALKYGALSTPDGRIEVEWRVSPPPSHLHLEWRETGGPQVLTPSRTGFGTRMLERGLARELNGAVRIDYLPEGARCTIKAPLPQSSADILNLQSHP